MGESFNQFITKNGFTWVSIQEELLMFPRILTLYSVQNDMPTEKRSLYLKGKVST